MKYWKEGFYDMPQDGAVEISDIYWQELLNGQSAGKEIATDGNGYPVLVEHEYSISEIRDMKLSEIQQYDKSETVNLFSIGDSSGWFDKSTRVGLQNSINIEKGSGKVDTTLWIANKPFILSIEVALDILRQIELYAISCNNVTQTHIATVIGLTDKAEIEGYDFTVAYPDKLLFPYE